MFEDEANANGDNRVLMKTSGRYWISAGKIGRNGGEIQVLTPITSSDI
jgi:hypothetical protein